ncbi:MAG: hypothetical protein WCR58_01140 [Bacteroidales bacterium]|jgi:hypothetical protein|nr:hypothetical protein [Bacteroidales bacterium]MDD3700469.1 hypothetical protein [Bacteroidales bacterium]MDY0369881.1 hypothetical protein [Bacteroidales bacterium]
MEAKRFTLNKKTWIILLVMIAIGVVSLLYGALAGPGIKRMAANLLLNNYYFLSLGLIGLFFIAAHAVSESGWHTSVQRIAEAMSSFIPIGGVLLLVFYLSGGLHLLYEWTNTEQLDEVLQGKTPYLNEPFFYIRTLVFLAGWSILAYFIRKTSLQLDIDGERKYFNRLRVLSAVFLVFYALSSVISSWDWLMSIDAHWYSTLYGWYVFSSMLAAGIAMLIILLYVLMKMGYMEHVNTEHIHDLGIYLFGFSIFWAYLWFSQYMLIWYANIPEETVYFYDRHLHFSGVFYINLILCFVVPFLALMTRNSKRSFTILIPVSVLVVIGHWFDLYLLIMPGTIGGEASGFGLVEIGTTIGFLGLFALVSFLTLAKAPLAPYKHPFYKESLDYHTHY